MELIEGTVAAWCDALWHGRDWRLSDSERIEEAFRVLSRNRMTWPAPAEFLAAVPPRAELPKLPRKFTDEECRANLARLHQMVDELLSEKQV